MNAYIGVPQGGLTLDRESKRQIIEDILSRGKVVRFTNSITGVTKDIKEWNEDNMGDLIAFRHTGGNPYICWLAEQYKVSELDE
jgi:hypothetical protein